jgi:imidazolonepropionase-like amidohydrolase
MTLTILLAALAAQALPAPGSVTGWEPLPDDPSGRNFLDPASIRRQGDLVRVVVRGVAHSVAANGIESMMMRVRVDCRQRTLGVEAVDGYGADGRLLGSQVAPASAVAMAPAAGMASFAAIVARACRRGAR